ncbi:MAG: glycosyltransferase [Bacteroides sp.]|nr:glycosyltransferase [Bacteroides sp.]MCM1447843.1 glycosyltransferase [Bacteroides sp.]
MSKVSIIIPCYNAQDYIVKCLEALTRQTFKDFDVFLVNDCSTDNTESVIKDYQKTSFLDIHYLKNEINSGPAFSRNNAIAHSTADYICFCDSDDWYDADYLESMVAETSKNDADIVFCGFRLVWDSGKYMDRPLEIAEEQLQNSKLVIPRSVDSLCAMMVKRSIIMQVPQPNIRNGEDMAIIPLLVANSQKFGKVDKCLYNYLCREGSASSNSSLKVVDSLIASFDHIKKNMPNGYEVEMEFIGIRNLLYGALLNLYKCSNDNKKAKSIIEDFEVAFPLWYNNKYINILPKSKKLFLYLAHHKVLCALKAIGMLHTFIIKNN